MYFFVYIYKMINKYYQKTKKNFKKKHVKGNKIFLKKKKKKKKRKKRKIKKILKKKKKAKKA